MARFCIFKQITFLARRLDRFLISKLLQARVRKCEILPSLLSDHSPILIPINIEDGFFKKGKNYWKFNKLLLNDNVFVMGIKKNWWRKKKRSMRNSIIKSNGN